MFVLAENELKKIDYNFKMETFTRIIYIVLLIIFVPLVFSGTNYWLIGILFLIVFFIILLSVDLYINYLLKKEKLKCKDKRFDAKRNLLIEHYHNKKLKFFINFLKEKKINTKEKILLIYNEYKTPKNTDNIKDDSQSLFVIATTMITIFIQLFDNETKTADGELLIGCLQIVGICAVCYITYKICRHVIINMFFNDKRNIKLIFEELLMYFYLNFEEYEEELKRV